MLESSSVLSRLHTTRGRSADASVNWMNFSAGLRIVYHFSPKLTLASGATALGSVRAQALLSQTDPLPESQVVANLNRRKALVLQFARLTFTAARQQGFANRPGGPAPH